RLLEGQPVSGLQGEAFEATDRGARQGRLAAEHRVNIEAALHGKVGHRACAERAHAQHLAAYETPALEWGKAAAAYLAAGQQDVDGCMAPGDGDADAVGLHTQRRPLIGDLQRADAGAIADQQIGGAEAHLVECTGDWNAESLVARPS